MFSALFRGFVNFCVALAEANSSDRRSDSVDLDDYGDSGSSNGTNLSVQARQDLEGDF
jgi:hypothetical protein